ncbi:MAG TPA: class I SAM-dependent methyltransferase [Acidimicrobiales bacterium]|jgi:hypothetical protein
MQGVDQPVRLLDVGGTADYWTKRSMSDRTCSVADDERVDITLLNTEYFDFDGTHARVRALVGDGKSIDFPDASFDLVVSNSTLEHVGGLEEQRRMVREVRRVGRRCYVQVPCRWFPIEPHTGVPFFAVMPYGMKVWMLRHMDIGHGGRAHDVVEAHTRANDAHLLTARQTMALLGAGPAGVHRERVLGLTKSIAVVT